MMDALVQLKRMGNLLNEVQDLSRQMAEALDRDDRVSVEMLAGLRREPINKLTDAKRVLEEQAEALPEEEGRRLAALLDGAPAAEESERMLADQVAANRRRLDQVLALDKTLNQKLTREKSIYQ